MDSKGGTTMLDEISSKEKAAILIRTLEEGVAAKVIEYMTAKEKEVLLREIAKFRVYKSETLENVLGEFLYELNVKELNLVTPDKEYIRRIFKNMPEDELEKLLEDLWYNKDNPFEFLNSLTDLEPLLTVLNDESPQTIAIIASYIKPQLASQLIERLPDHKRVETVMGIAKLEQVDGELINQIGDLLKSKLNNMAFNAINKTDGLKTIVNILNNVSRGVEKTVFQKLDEMDYELSEKIKENMFVFEDLLGLEDLALRRVLEEITDNGVIAKALKIAKEEIKEKLFTCMSSNRKEMILEELDGLGPLKMTDAEKAQQTITDTVKKLEKEELSFKEVKMMSLFKNRIPKNSVSFSEETYELQFPKPIPVHVEEEIQVDHEELLAQQQSLHVELAQLRKEQQILERERQQLLHDQEQFQIHVQQQMKEIESARQQFQKEQQETAYEWTELLWDQSFQLAEKIVNQAVDARLLDVLPILTGIVQTLPTSFEKLVITVHPETFERIQEEKGNTKEYWLLQLVEWKYDFSLQFGEFVLEEEKEFFEFKFAPIFAKLRQKWEEEKLFEEQNV